MCMNKRCENMEVLILLFFTVPSVYSLVEPHCRVPGEYKQRVNSATLCQNGCEDGWYGDHCRRRCPEFCLKCDRVTGHCSGQCKKGYFGTHCSFPCHHCSQKCDAQGDCINEGTIRNPTTPIATIINSCRPGWFGLKCQLECNNCNNNGCEKQSGICHECREGYFGYICSDRCSENCNLNYNNNNKSSCSRYSGQCLYGCVKGWFGDRCENKCSLGCRNETCNKIGTKCSEGCIDGRYGDTCNMKCSKNCIKQLCENDGTCLEGCHPGWTGRYCLQNSPELEGGYATKFELIIAFSLLIIVLLAAHVIRKKMKNTKHKEPNSAPESVSLSHYTSTVTDHYDQINESQLESFSDISSNNSQQIPLCFNNNNNNQVYLHPIVEDVFIAELS